MAAAITEKTFANVGEVTQYVSGTIATTGDWVLLDGFAGTFDLQGRQFPTDNAAEELVWTYARLVAKGAVADTTTQTITYDGATANQRESGGYYIINDTSKEVMYVEVDDGYDSTTGDLTVQRGALGSTAVAVGDNDEFSILQCIVITASTAVGGFVAKFTPLPTDPKVGILG